MKKRIAALLLCCAMLLTLSPSLIATAAAEDELIPANGAAAESSVDEVQPETNDQIGGTVPETVVFTDAGPFLPAVSVAAARRMARATDTSGEDGLKLSKKATANPDGSYTVTMEAYTTGKVTTTTKTTPADIILVLDQSGSMAFDFNGNGTNDNTARRQYAMKAAVNSFIDEVNKKCTAEADHRIAIVTFGTNAATLQGWTLADKAGKIALENRISSLPDVPKGATNVAAGMQRAETLMGSGYSYTGANTQRQKVVIVFTDGVPTTQSNFSTSVANDAITAANSMKNSGVTIYSVGIFNGANPKKIHGDFYYRAVIADDPCDGSVGSFWGTTNLSGSNDNDFVDPDVPAGNRFLNYISNNYTADNIGLRFSDKDGAFGGYKWTITKNFSGSDAGYYLTADNSESLNKIFKTISENIQTADISLDAKTVIRDIVTPYFTMPANSEVKVYTDNYNGKAFANARQDMTGTYVPSVSGDTVSVTGFDFNANFISDKVKSDGTYGKKLIVEFTVRPKAGFLGGNGVPTNGADSGVYNDGNLIKNFEVPAVDVAVPAVTVTALDKNVYLMQMPGAADLKTDAAATCNGVNLLDEGAYTGSNAWKADFVNVSVEAKTSVGFDATADGTYTVTAKVSPKTNGSATAQKAEVTKAIKVFLPEQTFYDSQITLGNVADYADNTGALVWIHDTTPSTAVAMIGDAPELVYTFDPAAKAFAQDTEVRVTDVKIGGKNAAQYVTFYRDACAICQAISGVVEGDAANFVVHVKSLSLTIVKNFSGGAPMDPNQSAVFTVSGPMGTLDVILNNANGFRVTINGLKSGEYTVVEKNDWTWRYTPDKLRVSVTLTGDETVMPTVTFTNKLSNSYWLSGGAYCDNRWSISNTPAIN